MPETLRKVYDCETKKLDDYTFEFTASTEAIDRDGEVIEAKGWDLKNFKKNPVIMYGHDYRSLPIGRASKVWVSEGTLKNHVEFPPEGTYEFADIVRRLLDAGYLKTESVGFVPKEWEDGAEDKLPKRTYKKTELLEISIVPVPSNPDALIQAKDAGVITTKELEIITKPEETDDWIRIPVAECDVTATIDISKKEGIKALYCGKEKKVRTYMFDKREPFNWTMARAKKWVEEHKGVDEEALELAGIEVKDAEILDQEHPIERTVSQGEIKDEFDYLVASIKSEGLNEDNLEQAWELVREVMRLQGDDTPLDIAEKVGAVLNQKNKDRLEQIKALAQQVLDSAQHEEEPKDDKVIEPEITLDEVIQIVKSEVTKAIAKAQGKLN